MDSQSRLPSRRDIHRKDTPVSQGLSQNNSSSPKTRTVLLIIGICCLVVGSVLIGVAIWQRSNTNLDSKSIRGALDQISIDGKQGAVPVLSLANPVSVTSVKSEVLIPGTGREITADSPVLLGVYPFSSEDGSVIGDSAGPEFVVGNANETDLGAVMASLVVGQNEGSRILVVRPTTDGKTEIDVVDILSTLATGKEIGNSSGPLSVTITDEGPIISHSGDAPSEVTVQTLIQGEGSQIQSGDRIVVQYLALLWSDDTVIASSWAEGLPQTMVLDQMMAGLREALVDKRVGSRLAVTIPPELAAGDDTVAVVVDILGASSAA